MSRFLKTLDILIFIVALLAGAALLVPPYVGIDAIVIEENSTSNADLGSVIYSQAETSEEIAAGDQIVISGENDAVNLYTVNSYDAEQHIVTASKDAGEEEIIDVGSYVSKAIIVIPFLGYLKMATESMTGLMILGGCVLVWIILMILSIVLRIDYDDDEDDEDEDDAPSADELTSTGTIIIKRRSLKTGARPVDDAPVTTGVLPVLKPVDDGPVAADEESSSSLESAIDDLDIPR